MQRNLAGNLVGPERQCLRGDGTPKKVFDSRDEALASIAKGNMRRYEPYCCAQGIGTSGTSCGARS